MVEPPVQPQSIDAGTEYVILTEADDVSVGWVPLTKRYTARSREAAVKLAAADNGDKANGNYIPIPLNSWKSFRVTPRTETRFVVEEAS